MPIFCFILLLFKANVLLFSSSLVAYLFIFAILTGVKNGRFNSGKVCSILLKNVPFEV